MITKMEITYRSESPCDIEPGIFTTGGYTVSQNGKDIHFDFEDMRGNCRFESGFLYVDAVQSGLDYTVSEGIEPEALDNILRSAKKEDFTEIYYECYADEDERNHVKLIPESIIFHDFDKAESIEVKGSNFINAAYGGLTI